MVICLSCAATVLLLGKCLSCAAPGSVPILCYSSVDATVQMQTAGGTGSWPGYGLMPQIRPISPISHTGPQSRQSVTISASGHMPAGEGSGPAAAPYLVNYYGK